MTVSELIQRLSQFPQDIQIMILDSHNGGGCPREVNLGPKSHVITDGEADDCADCEDWVGDSVVVMGYGCY